MGWLRSSGVTSQSTNKQMNDTGGTVQVLGHESDGFSLQPMQEIKNKNALIKYLRLQNTHWHMILVLLSLT